MKNNIFITLLFVLFLLFIGLYIIGNSSYYDYDAARRTRMTSEEIEYFEQELDNGSEIDINGYLSNDDKNYDNLISDTTMQLSNKLSKSFSKALNFLLNGINKALQN